MIVGGFLNDKLHGYCLTYMQGKLESLQHYEEGEKVDLPIIHIENHPLPDDEAPFHDPIYIKHKGHQFETIK